ncbi:putative protein S-acyltransferase 14 [Dichanthelium oligosanthes]|uniref:Protein S-acyltransferase n=1 Tax=Dichanthelium oligosanthes TaxID=888268 RepID=A0A1E5VRT5_9POAL|nr:putative protein S-acyltransferase 14 [Dichanthelium oligosanthes]
MYRSAGAAMAWNVFRFCTALRGLGSIMILLVVAIVGVTYYAVVLCNYGPALLGLTGGASILAALAVLLLFHSLLAMLLWSYFSVVFTDPGSVPPNWNLDFDVEMGETAPLASSEFSSQVNSQHSVALGSMGNPRVRYCRKCNQLKPPRCHHCSVLLNLAFSLSVLGFMIMHISLVSANTTTIEAYEKKTSPHWIYDLGWKRNFAQVFGNDRKYWFIPAYSEEDLRRIPALQGLDYPVRPEFDGQEL